MINRITLLLFIGLAFGQDCTADDGTDGVELWNVCYSIENTDSLILYNNQFTGSIPPEIGNLTNLERLYLSGNQLTGQIPENICNHVYNIDFDFSYNQLCPPYPFCFSSLFIILQDTSGCD